MDFADVIKTIFEFAAVVLLIVGFINEKKVIAFEIKLVKYWKNFQKLLKKSIDKSSCK